MPSLRMVITDAKFIQSFSNKEMKNKHFRLIGYRDVQFLDSGGSIWRALQRNQLPNSGGIDWSSSSSHPIATEFFAVSGILRKTLFAYWTSYAEYSRLLLSELRKLTSATLLSTDSINV